MKINLIAIAVLIALAGCVQPVQNGIVDNDTQNQTTQDAVMEMVRYGAFTLPEWAVTEIRVDSDSVTYTTKTYDGEVTLNVSKQISEDQYTSLRDAFEQADFWELPAEINPDVIVADVGMGNITLIEDGRKKTVHIDPFYDMPSEIQNMAEQFQNLGEYAQEMSSQEAEEFAEEFVRNTPTFKYDGSDLELIDHVVMESYPTQHRLTFEFTSSHAGYGDREGQMVAQVITPHTIVVEVTSYRVTSAVIDGTWDAINQELTTRTAELTFRGMQCEETPWEEWYAEGNINYVRTPTDEQLITDYYASLGVEIQDVARIESQEAVCQACNVCPQAHYFIARVSSGQEEVLLEDGWTLADPDQSVSN